jgi:hypothetical protein
MKNRKETELIYFAKLVFPKHAFLWDEKREKIYLLLQDAILYNELTEIITPRGLGATTAVMIAQSWRNSIDHKNIIFEFCDEVNEKNHIVTLPENYNVVEIE